MVAKFLIVATVVLLLCGNAVDGQGYDLVILNGRVIDPETMLDDVLNVGVSRGKITAITKRTIKGNTIESGPYK